MTELPNAKQAIEDFVAVTAFVHVYASSSYCLNPFKSYVFFDASSPYPSFCRLSALRNFSKRQIAVKYIASMSSF